MKGQRYGQSFSIFNLCSIKHQHCRLGSGVKCQGSSESVANHSPPIMARQSVIALHAIHLPAIAMLFPTVHYRHPDEAPLDAAA